jgi:antitoxin ParD1/3/4
MSTPKLGRHFEAFVAAQVKSGRFRDSGEVLREGLRLLEEQERRLAQLAEKIDASFDEPGEDSSAEEVFDRLERRYLDDVIVRRHGA